MNAADDICLEGAGQGNVMKEEQMADIYRWQVVLGDRTVVVKAEDKLLATKKAAQELGVLWRNTARDMVVLRMGKVR